MTRRLPDRLLVQGASGAMVHYYGPNGPLCGWEGGIGAGSTDAPCECGDCMAVVNSLWRLWFPRTPLPSHARGAR